MTRDIEPGDMVRVKGRTSVWTVKDIKGGVASLAEYTTTGLATECQHPVSRLTLVAGGRV